MTDTPLPLRKQIPHGVADYFWAAARERRAVESALLDTFRGWGYLDVIPPTFEYADTLNSHANRKLQRAMYRFLDHDGTTLALRPDMTIAVARLVGTRLHDWPMPQRFCYAGSVFRHQKEQGGQQREFFQLGVELIGTNSPEADGEVLALTTKALRAVDLHDFKLVIGQLHYFRGLLRALELTPDQRTRLRRAIVSRSEPQLAAFLDGTSLTSVQRNAVEAMLTLNGDPLPVIDQADRHCLNGEMGGALENLRAIYEVLQAYDVAAHAQIDLAEVHNLGYYTGITFGVFAPQIGFSIASGGRYDNVIGSFGPDQPAVGVAMGLERILLARHEQQTSTSATVAPPPPDVLVSAGNSAACLQLVQAWRERGVRVVVDVNGRQGAELWRAAQQMGAPQALSWTGDGFVHFSDSAASPEEAQPLSLADAQHLFT